MTLWSSAVELTSARLNDIEGGSAYPTDGTTDIGPYLQASYDAGRQVVLRANSTYTLNTAVFLDNTNKYRSFEIDLNGSILKLGSSLPTTAAFWRDTTVRWGFFTNTKRTALSSGVVTVDDTTRASGTTVGNLLPLIIRNGTIDGQGANRGAVFGNRCGHRFERVALSQGRTLLSWYDYSDSFVFDQCHNRKDTEVAASALCIQLDNGDGGEFRSCKADAGMGIADLRQCHGATITAAVTGWFKFSDCSGIVMTACHQEANIANDTGNITVLDSTVTMIHPVLYPPRDAAKASILISDATGGSNIHLVSPQTHRLYSSGSTPDAPWGALFDFNGAIGNTVIRVSNELATEVASGATADGWLTAPFAPILTPQSTVQTALDAAGALAVRATGYWELSRFGGGTAWRMMPLGQNNDLRATNVIATPVMTATASAATSSKLSGGTLAAGTVYYRCALYDDLDNHSIKSAEVNATVTSAGTVRLSFNPPKGGKLIVWRGTAADTYTRYIVLTAPGGLFYAWDTGLCISGQAWQTSPPTPPTTQTGVAAVIIDGVVLP